MQQLKPCTTWSSCQLGEATQANPEGPESRPCQTLHNSMDRPNEKRRLWRYIVPGSIPADTKIGVIPNSRARQQPQNDTGLSRPTNTKSRQG